MGQLRRRQARPGQGPASASASASPFQARPPCEDGCAGRQYITAFSHSPHRKRRARRRTQIDTRTHAHDPIRSGIADHRIRGGHRIAPLASQPCTENLEGKLRNPFCPARPASSCRLPRLSPSLPPPLPTKRERVRVTSPLSPLEKRAPERQQFAAATARKKPACFIQVESGRRVVGWDVVDVCPREAPAGPLAS